MFLVLTAVNGTTQIRINVDSIESYDWQGTCTFVRTVCKYTYPVKETPEAIDKALQEGYVYLKRLS